MRRIISLLLAIIMAITVFPLNLFADNVIDNGTCGDNLTWELTSDGTLTISGTGAMYEYGYVYDSLGNHTYVPYPWESYLEAIKSCIIGKEVTSVDIYFSRSLERITFNGKFTECDYLGSRVATTTICGYNGSTAEKLVYSMRDEGYNNITFESLGEAPFEVVASGTCGDNLTWEFTSDCTLTISGTGAMYKYGHMYDGPGNYTYVPYPWESYLEMIKSWIIGKGVASVRLYFLPSLERITFNGKFTECTWEGYFDAAITICGYNDSTAEDLAYSMRDCGYNITFESLGEAPFEVVASGTCGENLTWELTSDGTLTISGTGAMDVMYGNIDPYPWEPYLEKIKSYIIGKEVTSVKLFFSRSLERITFNGKFTECDFGGYSDVATTICGYNGSTAEKLVYSMRDFGFNNITFESLGEAPFEVVASGTCGDNLTWEFTSDCTLTISGTGAMMYGCPWQSYRDMIKSWIIGKEVTSVKLDFSPSLERITFNGMLTECNSWEGSLYATTTICGYNGSTAEDLAYYMRDRGYNITFESLGEAPFEVVASGTCGDNLTWEFTSDCTLTISGTGAMDKYGYVIDEETQEYTFNAAPWANWIDYARRLVVENGVTELSRRMLSNNDGSIYSRIESVSLPASLTQMGDDFYYLNYLKELMIDENNETYTAVDNVLYTKDMTTMLIYPRGKDDSHYTMPETVQYMGDDIHYGDIFLNNNIKSVVLSKNLTQFNGVLYCPLFGHITFLNPDTIIPQTDDGSSIFDDTNTIVIYGFAGSTAQKYAQEYNMTFVDLTEKTGELTFDGEIDREDALHLLYNSIFGDADYTIFQDCDYNGDGTIDRKDAVYLLYHSIFGAEEYPI